MQNFRQGLLPFCALVENYFICTLKTISFAPHVFVKGVIQHPIHLYLLLNSANESYDDVIWSGTTELQLRNYNLQKFMPTQSQKFCDVE